LFFDADAGFFLWPDAAVDDAGATVGGGLRGFFALLPSLDNVLSPLRLIVYGSSSELAGLHHTHVLLLEIYTVN